MRRPDNWGDNNMNIAPLSHVAHPVEFLVVHTADEHSYAAGDETANDLLSSLAPEHGDTSVSKGELVGGFARRIEYIEKIRESTCPTLVFSAGDFLEGDLWFKAFQGRLDIDLMNRVGYDAVTLGNHDFVHGWAYLQELLEKAEFPVISANLFTKDSSGGLVPILPSHKIFTIDGEVKIAVIGILGNAAYQSIPPDQRQDLYLEDPAKTLEKLLKDPSIAACDQILLLSHAGIEEDRELARKFPALSAILGGHSHTPMARAEMIETAAGTKTPVIHPYRHGQVITNLFFNTLGVSSSVEVLGPRWNPVSAKAVEVDALIQGKIEEVQAFYTRDIAQCVDELLAEGKEKRLIPLGAALSDILRSMAGADIGFVLSGSIKQGFSKGQKITLGDMMKALPHDDPVMKMEVNGAWLEKMMIEGDRRWEGSKAQFQYAGIEVVKKEDGTLDLFVGERALDRKAWYTVAAGAYFFQREIMDRNLQILPELQGDGSDACPAVHANPEILPDTFTQGIIKGMEQGASRCFVLSPAREEQPEEAM